MRNKLESKCIVCSKVSSALWLPAFYLLLNLEMKYFTMTFFSLVPFGKITFKLTKKMGFGNVSNSLVTIKKKYIKSGGKTPQNMELMQFNSYQCFYFSSLSYKTSEEIANKTHGWYSIEADV